MAVRKVLRVASGLQVNPVGGPNWNTVRVDPSTDTFVFGTGTSGTTEKTAVDTTSTQTLTNKTLTSPTITGATQSGGVFSDVKVLAATQSFTTNSVLATLTGFSWTLVAGATYQFYVNLPTTMTTNGGLSVALKYTTATASVMQAQTYAATASDNTTAVSTQSTTTTDATKYFDSKTAAYTLVRLEGTLVVGTGGTVAIQVCQNTSNSDTTSVLVGAYAEFTRVL